MVALYAMPAMDRIGGGGGSPFFTVLTPTYNRADMLADVYASLCAQSYRNFEWIVVDDGSTDATAQVVSEWAKQAPFPVRLLQQPNRGKHSAVDAGVAIARGTLLVIFDSDDRCVPDALATMRRLWDEIPPGQRDGYAGIMTLCQSPDGAVVGQPFPDGMPDVTRQELLYRYRADGERWAATRVDLHRRFPFPEVQETVKFLPEGLVWHRLAREHRLRCANVALRIFQLQGDGLSDRVRRRDPAMLPGLIMFHVVVLDEDLAWFGADPVSFLKSAANLVRYSLHAGRPLRSAWRGLRRWPARLLMLAMLPVGVFLYLKETLLVPLRH